MTDTSRKLATIRRIDALNPIEGADRILCATVGGWQLVTQKSNDLKVGDLVLYFEVDSWIPTAIAPFLTKPGHFPKQYNGVEGERLKTIKLKGQISQGLLFPLDRSNGTWELPVEILPIASDPNATLCVEEGDDLTELLSIQKWEKTISANLAGVARGNFPLFIPKTDEERVQNLTKELRIWTRTDLYEYEMVKYGTNTLTWELTEKLEGSSMTAYLNDGVFSICSRNLDLLEDLGNAFWKTARVYNIEEKMRTFESNLNWAIQGELIGPGVQGNYYKLKDLEFRVFNIFNITEHAKVRPSVRRSMVKELGLMHAPVLDTEWVIFPRVTAADLLIEADGTSQVGDHNVSKMREGIVFKCNEAPELHFKAVSNAWLLKNE